MIFIIIGILIGSTLLEIDIPFLKNRKLFWKFYRLQMAFFTEENGYTEMIIESGHT